jgi:hypothetical protein
MEVPALGTLSGEVAGEELAETVTEGDSPAGLTGFLEKTNGRPTRATTAATATAMAANLMRAAG